MFIDFPGGSDSKVSAYNAGDLGSIPGLGRSPGEGNGNPLQDSCLENSMDGGAWWATVHGVTKSRTRLSDFTFTFTSPIFIAAVFTIAKTWKQTEGPLTDEWINKMWCTYTMEYYSAIKNEIMPLVATWMELEMIILSEVRQRQISSYHSLCAILKNDTNELIYKTKIDSKT